MISRAPGILKQNILFYNQHHNSETLYDKCGADPDNHSSGKLQMFL